MGAWLSMFAPASPVPWSALPPELLDLILRRLSSHADRVRFASVCHQWRRTAAEYSRYTLPPLLPWLLQFDGITCPQLRSFPDGKLHSFIFSQELDYTQTCIGSFGSWLLFKYPWPRCHNTLWNLLTGATVQLPEHCNEPECLSPYELRPTGTTFTCANARKVIVCSPDLIAGIVSYYRNQDLVMCCRPGMSSWSTGLLYDYSYRRYQDMAYYEGRIYAVSTSGDLFVHEVTEDIDHTVEPRVCRLERLIKGNNNTFDGPPIFDDIYLVISCTGKLLMVHRPMYPQDNHGSESSTKIFRIFEADFVKSRWLEVESLGDQVLFVGTNCSRAIRASDHGNHLQGSTIYFLREHAPTGDRFFKTISPHTCGLYDMCSNTICPISLGDKHVSAILKAAWFFP
ncbi:unnamed protein product [Urochloa humidicola]